MVWLKLANGKSHPVDANTVDEGYAGTFDPSLGHRSHFDTCPDADKFRRKTKPKSTRRKKPPPPPSLFDA